MGDREGLPNRHPAGRAIAACCPGPGAFPHSEVGAAFAKVSGSAPSVRLALDLLALTACCVGEVTGAKWSEVDFESATWVVPATRMKQITGRSLADALRRLGVPALSHGFRSSFRDWAAEETNHPRVVIEAALAHVVSNATEAADRRTDLFERRRRLMADWAGHLAGGSCEP